MTEDRARAFSRRTLLGGAACGAALVGMPPALAGLAQAQGAAGGAPFPLIIDGQPATIFVDSAANSAVQRVAASFADDLERVSGRRPRIVSTALDEVRGPVVVIGVVGHSPAIDGLAAAGKIDLSDLPGAWEAFRHEVIANPAPGVAQALVIAGSDRRGAVFGTYDLSERIGVSPWHWFADVPVVRQANVMLPPLPRRDQPKVRYRGFFINDEDPCLSGWAKKTFGGVNAAMYAHVFELLLRMKGNYLWPAMWGKAFADDDPASMVLADAMGVVMGTSHHEPMLRAQAEWHRHTASGVTGGPWDYLHNGDNLRTFWRGGIARAMSKADGTGYESVVTVGMRGDGDEAMAAGTATALLERIVTDQRTIIAEVTGKPASKTPQVWALYKEVQDYYDHGMQVPEDVTLLFSDDNWGQIRRLPNPAAPPRAGGYGVYYHFDYVGAPRNYRWINTNQIEKVWQQMDLAYRRNARAMWIVNVGDIKPMEYPLGFFLAMAWDPDAMTPAALAAYPERWASATFGPDQAAAIGTLITECDRLTARRKPELINESSFALGGVTPQGLDGGAFGALMAQWDALEARMLAVRARLRPDRYDAYFQMVEFPIAAMANLYRLYYSTAWNRLLAADNDARANYFADQTEAAFRRDGELTERYHTINGGKWDGMMAQVHMNYVAWNDPTQQTMPTIMRVGGDSPSDKRPPRPRFAPPAAAPEGVVVIDATAFQRNRGGPHLRWTAIPHLGAGAGAMVALPQGWPATEARDAVSLEYDIDLRTPGPLTLELHLAPTLDTLGRGGNRIGVAFDHGPVRILQAQLEPTGGAQDTPTKTMWATAVCDNLVRLSADLGQVRAGRHTITVVRIDDNVVLQRIVASTIGPVPHAQLGPGSI